MKRKIASKEAIDILINNADSAILASEHLLQNTELIKSILTCTSITHYLQLLLDLLSGSLLAVFEVCSDLKNMLSTDNVYVKRYHMQMINLSQYEWCVYLAGRDRGGVIYKLINNQNKQDKDSKGLKNILKSVRSFGRKCDVGLRNITAHYDNPNTMYSMLITLNDEDAYAKKVRDQLSIHEMILKYISSDLHAITTTSCVGKIEYANTKSIDKNFSIEILNEKVAETFHNKEKLNVVITEQIANAWENIESHKKNYTICEKAIDYFRDKQADYSRLTEIRALEELRWEVSFMQYDLACSMNTYLKANSNAERSISFMRAYRIETSALSHLYGYNDENREKSIWNKIRTVPEFSSIQLSNEMENELKSMTLNLDSTKRNLYTHYRESARLNISGRWQVAKIMNHTKELMLMLHLVRICKKINKYIESLILSMKRTEKRENDEMLNLIREIKALAQKNNLQDVVQVSDKLLSRFSFSDNKS